ncbi:SANT/Myb domain [Dillenia turbinata]|uniref:Two-component response regulator n=1 Tax=Dillenia turbinata TaxID=194707 RepID=A0AAN8VHW0_9MAGN
MNCGRGGKGVGAGSMSAVASGGVSDQFPAGLRVLVVDDDPTCLMILERMLKACRYEVTKCNRAETALTLLRQNKNGFDVVISDVHMPDMDGFKLLEHIGLEMDLPVIMMSADDGKQVVMKGITHGACDYLIKPIRIEALKNIWQHVVRKRKNEWKDLDPLGSGVEDGDRPQKVSDDADYTSSANEDNWKGAKKRKDGEEEVEERDETSTLKKPRVVWSVELHQQFVAAVNQLGTDKAVPKKILELMNVPGLTRENVASHLQKYRLYLKRICSAQQQPNGLNLAPQDAAYVPLPSLNGFDYQAVAAAGQLQPQSLATLQMAGLGRPGSKSGIGITNADQKNLFSFENPKSRYGDELHQQQIANAGNQPNLLHGIPTTMEPRQLAHFQQSSQSFGNLNMQINTHGSNGTSLMMSMAQQPPRGAILNEVAAGNVSRIASQLNPMNGNAGILVRNVVAENSSGQVYNPVVTQGPSMVDFVAKHPAEFSSSGFPLASTPGTSSIISKVPAQDDINSQLKGAGGYVPSYDIFSELQQHKSQDWALPGVGLNFDGSLNAHPVQGSFDVSPSVLVNQGISSGQRSEANSNASPAGSATLLPGQPNGQTINQHLTGLHVEGAQVPKVERDQNLNSQHTLYSEQFGQDDLMTAILKQQQFGLGAVEPEFDFDGFPMDNVRV